ncbi:MAG TPA: hypothetical protein VLJ58_19755 [Ramlibacter sp.]|nr:hypothetical protein [Ramlibacter sp.]
MLVMSKANAVPSFSGQIFRDRDGQRWWVRGPRPGSVDQFVVEAEVKSSYPRVDLYLMTEPEFREHARAVDLRPEKSSHKPR